jgi:hypothetical protein
VTAVPYFRRVRWRDAGTKQLVSMFAVVVLAGCSTDCTDPAHAGFFGGFADVASGCYERQERLMQAQAAEAADRREALRRDAAALQERARSLSEEQWELAQKLAASQGELADSSHRLDAVKRANASQMAELMRLREKEATLKQQLGRAGQGDLEDRSDINRLVAENQELAAQISRFIRQLPVEQ